MYCKKCGGKVESYASHCPFCGEAMGGNDVTATYTTSIPAQSGAHRSVLGWIGTYLLMGLPLVGIIMLFVWAFGDKTKADPTFRNWARMMLIVQAVAVVLVVVYIIILGPVLFEVLESMPL